MTAHEDERLKRQIERALDGHKRTDAPSGRVNCSCGSSFGAGEQHAVHIAEVVAGEVQDFNRANP